MLECHLIDSPFFPMPPAISGIMCRSTNNGLDPAFFASSHKNQHKLLIDNDSYNEVR